MVGTELQRTPDDVRTHEEAASRCAKAIKRRVLKKLTRKARAEHLVRCSLAPGKKKAPGKLLAELFVDAHFTEDREAWQKTKLQRHCEEVYTDQEETKEVQEKRIEFFEERRPTVHSGRAQCRDHS